MLVKRATSPAIHSPAVELDVVAKPLAELDVDLVAVGIASGDELPDELRDAPGAADVKSGAGKVALIHPTRPERALAVGLGDRDEVDAERLRVAAAQAVNRAGGLDARRIAWLIPSVDGLGAGEAGAALVEGTVLGSYRFDRLRRGGDEDDDPEPARVERLVLVANQAEVDEVEAAAGVALVAAEAANRARDLQNTPANLLTPQALAERAAAVADAHPAVEVDALDRAAIADAGMGGLVAVSQGSATEPRLITMRYRGGGAGPTIGLVGKAVTFDSGGISIKPSSGMHEMKMDMSGGAAVIEAVGAIAELGLDVDLVAAVPATENMPSGTATRPGDVITQANGKTVEINNTDAEGRLILADALTYCVRELGAERLVDLATLTGAVLIALGSTYAALISNDDEWAAAVAEAAQRSGELAWRLPLHPEYKRLTKGTIADLTNSATKRKAGTIYAGSFLEEFVDDVPWVHLDIAGTSWDTGREYVGKGATGFGVRLLVALAQELSR
jgi:leucyl aminopeptidase